MSNIAVTRSERSLVGPCEPTPAGDLCLSAIDRVPGLRHMVRSLHVFRSGRDAAKVIKEALSKALVKYYPFAGRFVAGDSEHGGDVLVRCTGEGVWFVEATASCSLEDVNYLDQPLMISQDELLPELGPTRADIDPIDLPTMMQVTDFTCGGFVVGLISVHTIADGLGAAQFVNAVGEYARGLSKLTREPVWARELIPSPPKPIDKGPPVFPSFKLQYFTMDIPQDNTGHLKAKFFEQTGIRCSTFDASLAKVWQARVRAIKLEPDANVHLCFFANCRHLLQQILPKEGGYYGNCFYPVTVTAKSGRVAAAELTEVVKIIRDAKARLPKEFTKWAAGGFKDDDPYELMFSYNSLFVSDWTRLGFLEVDYGWGAPVQVIPFAYVDFMAVAILGAPPVPKKGTRVMTHCVEKEHLDTFQNEMKVFA